MVPIRNTAHEEVPRITPLCPIYQVKWASFRVLCDLSNEKCATSRAPRHGLTEPERRLLSEPVRVPVLSLVGRDDGAWSALDHAADAQFVDAPLTQIVIREAGHFLPEEAPD